MATAVQPTPAAAPATTPTNAAPNAASNAAPTPVAPDAPAQTLQDLPTGVSGMIERITRKAVPAENVTDPSAAPTTPLTDATAASAGTPIVPSDASAGTADSPSADGVPPLTDPPAPLIPQLVAEIKADEPEGEVMLRARDPKTGQFSEMDQTRVYELSIKDKETGESRVYNKTLPELMRMAKDGVASRQFVQRTSDELAYYRDRVPQWQQEHSTLASEAEGYKALAIELLTAPEDLVVARRESYAAEQTPEKELARLRARLAQQDRQTQATAQDRAVQQQVMALGSRISGTMQRVQELVGPEAAAGKVMIDTAKWMQHGRIAPEFFPQFEAYVSGPLRQWAEGEAAKRTQANADTERQRKAAEDAARLAQQRAQAAVNAAGAPLKPSGALHAGAQVPQGKPKNVTDAINRIVQGGGRPVAGAA